MRTIDTADAHQSSSPFPQAIDCGDYVFVSGFGGFDADTEELVSDELGDQVDAIFDNVATVLETCDLELDDIVKLTAYLTDADSLPEFNEAYERTLPEPYPARTTVATELIFDGKIEIDVVAKR